MDDLAARNMLVLPVEGMTCAGRAGHAFDGQDEHVACGEIIHGVRSACASEIGPVSYTHLTLPTILRV